MKKLHLGCGNDYMEGYVNLDTSRNVKADVYFDLESCGLNHMLPFEDDTFEEIQANHLLEHITNILPLMQELYRIAKPDCVFFIRVPYGATRSAFDDPTHIRYLYPTSFMYFGQPAYWRADYNYLGDWRVEEVGLTIHPKIAERLRNSGIDLPFAVDHLNNIVQEMLCAMIAVKPARARDATLQEPIQPTIEILKEDGTLNFDE